MKYQRNRPRRHGGVHLCLLLLLTCASPASADIHYVSCTDGTDGWPYTNWSSAATSIQPAIDAAEPGDTVLVTNGTYDLGEGVVGSNYPSRIAISNAIAVQSVNGSGVTTIDGTSDHRCAYVGTNGSLAGFTLANGLTSVFGSMVETSGGGLMCEGGMVSNCCVKNNQAVVNGGGAILYNGGTLRDCLVINNRCNGLGGGVYCYNGGTLQNCTIATNRTYAGNGGGIACDGGGAIQNTIIYGNRADGMSGTNWYNSGSSMTYQFTCTTPLVTGASNITGNPLFVNPAAANYRLQFGSPCIDRGTNEGWMAGSTDLDGTNRVMNGTVDIGAYEYVFYDIVATAWTNGSIAPSGTVRVARTGSASFTITPDLHYHVSNVVVDAVFVGPSNNYTFSNVTSNHSIDAFFTIDTYTLVVATVYGTAVPWGTGGTNTYDYGTTVDCAIVDSPVPNGTTQYMCIGWSGAGSVPAVGTTTNISVTITNDSTLTWSWMTNYWLDTTAGPNGDVSVTDAWFRVGTNLFITALPSNGYHFVDWTNDILSTTNPLPVTMDRPYSVTANFAINLYDITATAGVHGAIAPSGVVQVAHGESTNFVITPDEHYHVQDVKIDSGSIGVTNDYTFSNVTTSHTIDVTFTIDTYTVVVSTLYGTATPSGTNIYDYNTNLTCAVSPTAGNSTTQYVCTGWTGAGSFPSSGPTNSVTADITNDSTLAWQWTTNYWLHPVAGPDGTVSPGDDWYAAGSSATITATPAARATFSGWTGDIGAADPNNDVLPLTMDRPRAVTANFTITTHYVSTNGGHASPYTNWVGAATNIQDAVDVCEDGARVLVSNGVYGLVSPIVITNGITNGIRIDSVNGAGVTTIDGNQTVQCIYSDNSSNVVDGFTIKRGRASEGGGLRFIRGIVRNCIITDNTATNGGGLVLIGGTVLNCSITDNMATNGGGLALIGGIASNCTITGNGATNGGGAYLSSNAVLRSCLVAGNTAQRGGGVYFEDTGTVQNCTIVDNSAVDSGGGLYSMMTGTVRNCILYSNSAAAGTNWFYSGGLACSYDCTTPAVPGTGNMTNNPLLTPMYRLRSASPCVDAGTTTGAPATDLEGRPRWDDPRHSSGPSIYDLGAFEFTDADLDNMDDYWEVAQFGSTNISNGTGDADGDGLSDRLEYENSFCPTNATTYGDSLNDLWKAMYVFNQPHTLQPLSSGDSDQDGLPDSWETNWFGAGNLTQTGTNDYDIDTLSNWGEYLLGLNPTNTDSDADGLTEGAEVNTWYTDPRTPDTDGDGCNDGAEVGLSTDPLNPASFPATISGTIAYTGSLPGTVWVIVTNAGVTTSASLAAPGAYSISNRPTLTNYWLRVYRDSNGNSSQDSWEAAGSYSNNPVFLTNHAAGIDMALIDPTFGFVVSGSPRQLGSPLPAYGSYVLTSCTVKTNSVGSPVIDGATQYVCTGWIGTGSVLPSGGTTNTTVTITNDSTLTWNWQAEKFYLTAQAGPNGSISGTSGWYAANSQVTNTVTPSNGYHFAGWTGDVPPANTNDTTLVLTLDFARSITANFAINVYDITNSAGANGSVTPGGVIQVLHGGSTNIVITPDANYHVDDVQVDMVAIGPTNSYTFNNVTTSHTLHADFAIDMYRITATAGLHGTIAPSGAVWVPYDGGTNFAMTPDLHYYVSNVVVDSVSVGVPTNYTFSNVTTNHTIDVSFDNQYRLAAGTQHGTAVPVGTNLYSYGTTVDCAIVDSPVANGTTQYVCTGWIGAGSVPATGAATNLDVIVTNDSTLAWLWATNYWLAVTSGANGEVDTGAGWYVRGSNLTITATPSNHYHFVNWTGTLTSANNPLILTMGQPYSIVANFAIDTNRITASTGANGLITPIGAIWVPYDGSTNFTITPNANYHISNVVVDTVSIGATNSYTFSNVTTSHSITAVFTVDLHDLVVNSLYGLPSPAAGTNVYGWNTAVNARMSGSPIVNGMTQRVCTGWSGTGSVPISGSGTNTGAFNIRTNSTITWNWKTQYRLSATNGPNGSVTVSNGWYDAGTPGVTVRATPSTGYHFVNWTGDLVSTDNPLTLTMDWGYSLTANFAINTYDITATAGANGSIVPNGTVTVIYGGSTNFAITPATYYSISNVVVDGASIGPTNSYGFLNVTNSHTISASFAVTQCSLVVSSPYDTPVPPAGANALDWNSSVSCRVTGSPVVKGTTQYVCVGWVGAGSVPLSGTGTNVNIVITNNSTLTWLWKTNYWLDTAAGSDGSVNIPDGWFGAGSNVTITATPVAGSYFADWSGDVPAANTNNNPLVLTMDRSRIVTANFAISPHYVSLNGKHVSPFITWANAATNIQAAVDVAAAGKTVLVSNGTYALSSPISVTKGIVVRSLNGAGTTIVDGMRAMRCFYVSHPNAIVSGFTIKRGKTTQDGGGVFVDGAGVLQNCTVSDNAASNYGGGVYLYHGGTVQNCTISGNSSTFGGGVQCEGAGMVTNCTISGNKAFYGGGVRCRRGGTVQDSVINNNTASSGGGGVQCVDTGMVWNCTIYGNAGGTYGGGVYCYQGGVVKGGAIRNNTATYGGGVQCEAGGMVDGCSIGANRATYAGGVRCKQGGTAQNCFITNNTAYLGGGGVEQVSAGTIRDCVVSGNQTTNYGGGVYLYYGGTVQNCTISGNSSTNYGGGIFCESGGTVENTILYFNNAGNGPNHYDSGPGMTYSYCCSTPLLSGTGNLAGDPIFVNAASRDYHLQFRSPCLDKGVNQSWMSSAVDPDGNPRLVNGTVDVGAYEWLDTDRDGLSGWEESHVYGTDLNNPDTDSDGFKDGAEVIAGTSPMNSSQFLQLDEALRNNGFLVISWESVAGRLYTLKSTTNLLYSIWIGVPGCIDRPGTGGTMSYTNILSGSIGYYRIDVRIGP